MIAILISRIREEQAKLALSAVQYPHADPLITGLNAGKWQGMDDVLKMIDEIIKGERDQD